MESLTRCPIFRPTLLRLKSARFPESHFRSRAKPTWFWKICAQFPYIYNIYTCICICIYIVAGHPGSSEVPRNPLTRWYVSSIPANGIFLAKKLKNKIKMPNGWRAIKSLVHKIRLQGRRGKRMAESFSREKLRHALQKEGG